MAESRLLGSLPADLLETLNKQTERLRVSRGETLESVGETINYVYFPTTCLLSMVVTLESGSSVEAATVGNDGFAGLAAFIGRDTADLTTMAQIDGETLRITVADFRDNLGDERFRSHLAAYFSKSLATVAQSGACIAFHPVHERLARWLLLVRDALERDEFALTHEFIAVMLGVHRPTVTIAVRLLESAGLIEHRRGLIRIVDGEALVNAACECYRVTRWRE